MTFLKPLIALLFFAAFTLEVDAQCDSTARKAMQFLPDSFISDGQSYRALLYDDQIAEFSTILYGNSKYRIVSYSGAEPGQLIFTVLDPLGNVLFTNEQHHNSTYWDFQIENTIEATIEAKLDLTKQTSGCAVLLIGFEK